MRRILLSVCLSVLALGVVGLGRADPVQAEPAAAVRIGICFSGAASGDWLPPTGYGSGEMKGTLYTTRPFRGATLYYLQAQTRGDGPRGTIVGWLLDNRGNRVASVRGSFAPSRTTQYQGDWRVTVYPLQSLSQIGNRRHYRIPGKISGTFAVSPFGYASTFTGEFRLCL
jgi:hypothetical protein